MLSVWSSALLQARKMKLTITDFDNLFHKIKDRKKFLLQ